MLVHRCLSMDDDYIITGTFELSNVREPTLSVHSQGLTLVYRGKQNVSTCYTHPSSPALIVSTFQPYFAWERERERERERDGNRQKIINENLIG